MNNQNMMMRRGQTSDAGMPEYVDPESLKQDEPDFNAYQTGMNMMPRGQNMMPNMPSQSVPDMPEEKEIKTPAPAAKKSAPPPGAKDEAAMAAAKLRSQTARAVQAAGQTGGTPQPPKKPAAAPAPVSQNIKPPVAPQNQNAGRPAAPVQAPKVTPGAPIKLKKSPDELCRLYIDIFKDSLGLELSSSICFENMRRFCECDSKNPDKALFFLENTYRLSTVLYLASNLPIIIIASILAEKNRKNIIKYVSTEVDNGAKPYDELKSLRLKRWGRKYENMGPNDAPTVTPGLTGVSGPMAAMLESGLRDISIKLKRFNKELTEIINRFDDSARSDVVYIYSNWWYLLQGFENVPEMRNYIMAITDDTRRNLKL